MKASYSIVWLGSQQARARCLYKQGFPGSEVRGEVLQTQGEGLGVRGEGRVVRDERSGVGDWE